jgi:Predicted membrane protein (DUF2306)
MTARRLQTLPQALLWLILLVPALAIGGFALRLVTGNPALVPYELRVNLLHAPIPFVLHTSFGGLAMLLGPWQFLTRIRQLWPALHRWVGRLYVGCCLISGLAAYPVALGTIAGPVAAAGFTLMATAWLIATAAAWQAIRARRIAAHRRWMIRSFALTLSAVTLRFLLLLPLAWPDAVEFMTFYSCTAWGSWILNLALAELYLRLSSSAPPARRRPQAA